MTIDEVKQKILGAMGKADEAYPDDLVSLAKAYQILSDTENTRAMTEATLKQYQPVTTMGSFPKGAFDLATNRAEAK